MIEREIPYDFATSVRAVSKEAKEAGFVNWGWPPLSISLCILTIHLLDRIEQLEAAQKKLEKKTKKNKCRYNEPVPPEFK